VKEEHVYTLLRSHRRILLIGAPGAGKSTLAAELATRFARDGNGCGCIAWDPGSPAFGPPGAVSVGTWREERWRLLDHEPLCTLDAGRRARRRRCVQRSSAIEFLGRTAKNGCVAARREALANGCRA
jgi:energy-coupling factor transporter ATP-binding protein EcfA2